MVKTHMLKTELKHFDQQKAGVKNFEYRKMDLGFRVGDMLHLIDIDDNCEPTGRTLTVVIECIICDLDGMREGYGILGTRRRTKQVYGVYDYEFDEWVCENNSRLYQFSDIHVAQAQADVIAAFRHAQFSFNREKNVSDRPIRARLYGEVEWCQSKMFVELN